MLGRGSIYADECKEGGFIGTNFLPDNDLSGHLPDGWKAFNKEYIPAIVR